MLTLPELQQKAIEMEARIHPILKSIGVDTARQSDETKILGLHESATKLWVSVMGKKEQEEIDRRVASALIGVLLLAKHFNVENLEDAYLKRLEEVFEHNKKAADEILSKKIQ